MSPLERRRSRRYSIDLLPQRDNDVRFIANSFACQAVYLESEEPGEELDCFCTLTEDYLNGNPRFYCATTAGPPTNFGSQFLSDDQVALRAFIEQKPPRYFNDEQLYQPLFDREIRILELHPATIDAPFEGALHIASTDFEYPKIQEEIRIPIPGMAKTTYRQSRMNHAISLAKEMPMWYTALSYTWGIPIFNQSIKIGKHLINITSDLAAAMRRLRSASHSVYLWIDQICLNQSDLREKEIQVPLMGMIYTQATNTLIWLGEEDGTDPQLAVRTLQDVHARLQMSDATKTPDDFADLHIAPAADRSWWAVRQLFRRMWFTRTWTIQEACLSRHCYMQCGTTIFSWDDIAAWSFTLEQSGLLEWLMAYDDLDAAYSNMVTKDLLDPPIGGTVINQIQGIRTIQLIYDIEPGKGVNSFLECLVMARNAAASNPKDKVYGILGISDIEIAPRYSEKIAYRDIYHEASVVQLTQITFAISLLSCVDAEQPLRPSWVPAWETPRVTQALGYSTTAWSLYMAGGDLKAERAEDNLMRFSEDKNRITIRGKLFDEIAHIGDVRVDPALCIDPSSMISNDWAKDTKLADNAASNAIYSAQHDSVYNAFFHTLMAGRDGSSRSPPSSDHSEVFSLILDSTTGREPSLPGQIYSVRRKKGHFTLASLVAKKGVRARKPVKVLQDMRIAFRAALHMRRFAVTKKGYFALVARGARVGDKVVVLKRCCVPFIVRQAGRDETDGEVFELVGETYVHGIMKGQTMAMHELFLRDITIV